MNRYRVWVAYPVNTPESAGEVEAESSFEARKAYAAGLPATFSRPFGITFRDCAAQRIRESE